MAAKPEDYPFLFDPNDRLREFMRANGKRVEYKKGELIAQSGKVERDFFFIEEGAAVLSNVDQNNQESAFSFHFNDTTSFTLCYHSYFYGGHSYYQLKTLEPSVVYRLHRDQMDFHMERNEEIRRCFHLEVQYALSRETFFRSRMSNYSLKENIEFIEENFPFILRRVPAKYMAQRGGVSREWFSKVRNG